MNTLPSTILNSTLWRTTLERKTDDLYQEERERFRVAFLGLRDRCGHLSSEIRKDLPDLTVHDLTHLDALWEIGSTIVGNEYLLTPTEGFVLGGAILLHDLAMSVAATEGGYVSIKNDVRWADLITFEYQTAYGCQPSAEQILHPEPLFQRRALFNLLRQIHAENAENLAFISYKSTDGTPIFLIEDTELRQTFGRIIGQIAHSHWWPITQIEKAFSRTIGSPHWCPNDWTVDPLKLACILRTADASHLDARRAPSFLKAISSLSIASEEHWTFQEKLNKPYLGEDDLVFTTGHAFRLIEAGAWWLCLENLRLVDRELRSVDALFAEKGYQRFAARRVAGVDTPERLRSYIQTDGWLPINATVHVSDLPGIIQSIGGDELYKKNPEVAFRELIQNACDAVQARRTYENRPENFGEINVKLSKSEGEEYWLEVIDTGIGMSQRVLTEFLLDFGRSFWGSPEMQEEFPGLLSSGLKRIGKYGIGFFSTFMVAEHVQVATRRSDGASRDTLVLEFKSGLSGRPILRPAIKKEELLDGGTHVKLKLIKNPYEKNGLLCKHNSVPISLTELCLRICPAIDVDLYVVENDVKQKVIASKDWLEMDGADLLARMDIYSEKFDDIDQINDFKKNAANNLRLLKNENDEIVGRALITVGFAGFILQKSSLGGVVTIGGLRSCGLSGVCGVLVGQPARASRDAAVPIVSDVALKSWASEQADLIPNLWNDPERQAACAQYIRLCGGETKQLPICRFQGRWISAEEIARMVTPPEVAILVDDFTESYELRALASYELDDNVFVSNISGIPGLLQAPGHIMWPRDVYAGFTVGNGRFPITLGGAVIQALCKAWGVRSEDLAENHEMEREDTRIGQTEGRELCVRAIRISKPVSNKSAI